MYLSPFPMLLLNLDLHVNQFVKVSNQSSISSYADRDRDSGVLVLGDLRGRENYPLTLLMYNGLNFKKIS